MKLHNGTVARKGDKLKYTGVWTDKMRRPATVKLMINKGPEQPLDPQVWAEGDIEDITSIMDTIAQQRWNEGWRPSGLINGVASFITGFKTLP